MSSIFAKFLGFKSRFIFRTSGFETAASFSNVYTRTILQGIWQIAPVRRLKSMKSFVVGKIFLIVFIGLVQTFTLEALKILIIFSVKPVKYGSKTNSFLSLLEKLASLI